VQLQCCEDATFTGYFYVVFSSLGSFVFRTLGTPNNEVWPDVESLPDYKNTFPKWKSGNLANTVKNLDKNGIDLLMVRGRPDILVSYLSVCVYLPLSPHIFSSSLLFRKC